MDFNKKNPADKAISSLGKFKVMGKGRAKSWYTFASLGIVLGAIIAVAYVANQQGQFSQPKAAGTFNGLGNADAKPPTLPSKTGGLTPGSTVRNTNSAIAVPTTKTISGQKILLQIESNGSVNAKDSVGGSWTNVGSLGSETGSGVKMGAGKAPAGSVVWTFISQNTAPTNLKLLGNKLVFNQTYELSRATDGAIVMKDQSSSKPVNIYGRVWFSWGKNGEVGIMVY